jgi:hypothetical protein
LVGWVERYLRNLSSGTRGETMSDQTEYIVIFRTQHTILPSNRAKLGFANYALPNLLAHVYSCRRRRHIWSQHNNGVAPSTDKHIPHPRQRVRDVFFGLFCFLYCDRSELDSFWLGTVPNLYYAICQIFFMNNWNTPRARKHSSSYSELIKALTWNWTNFSAPRTVTRTWQPGFN